MALRRYMIERHLRRVYGSDLSGSRLRRLVAGAFASYARYWAEALQVPSLSAAEIDAVTVPSWINLMRAPDARMSSIRS